MISIDFKEYTHFSICPIWWQNFVVGLQNETQWNSLSMRNDIINAGIERFNGSIIEINDEDIDSLIFETDDDFNAFKLYWTLYGK